MSVNTMEFKDAAAILNNIRKQVTGETAIAPANTSEFVSVATTLLQAGYDPVLNAITQMVSRTIFSITLKPAILGCTPSGAYSSGRPSLSFLMTE